MTAPEPDKLSAEQRNGWLWKEMERIEYAVPTYTSRAQRERFRSFVFALLCGVRDEVERAAKRAAFEEAAKICEGGHFLTNDSLEAKMGRQMAAALRKRAEEER